MQLLLLIRFPSQRSWPHLTFPHLCHFVFLQRNELGALVSLEMGKIRTEGVGEVQEFVDIVSVVEPRFAHC